MKRSIAIAKEHWGQKMPDWLRVLAAECDASNQVQVGDRIGYSGSMISQVLRNKYKGSLAAVEQAVQGGLLGGTVQCPVIGELKAHICLEHQRKPFSASNPQRVELYRACRSGCANAKEKS